jgi:hypothetical protein
MLTSPFSQHRHAESAFFDLQTHCGLLQMGLPALWKMLVSTRWMSEHGLHDYTSNLSPHCVSWHLDGSFVNVSSEWRVHCDTSRHLVAGL